MDVDEITKYLAQKDYKNIDRQGVAYKLTGADKETVEKYIGYIQRIGKLY